MKHDERMNVDTVYTFIENHYGEPIDHAGMDEPINALIAVAVAAEREACARIADDRSNGCIAKCNTATRISAAIRARH